MNLSENQIIEKYGKRGGHYNGNILLPDEYEFTCFSCGYNVIKRKHELARIQKRKLILSMDQNMQNKKYFVYA